MAKPQTATAATSTTPTPFPNDGALVQTEGSPVCQIVSQQLVPLPNFTTAISLYGQNWKDYVNIVTAEQFNSLPVGPAYDLNACLVKSDASAEVGLYTWGRFYWIHSEEIFNTYQFDWSSINVIPQAVFAEMPQGLIITG